MSSKPRSIVWVLAGIVLASNVPAEAASPKSRSSGTLSRAYIEARALFEKTWVPGVPALAGGDGLGPLYNEASCVACHNQGGAGGGGGDNSRNVTIISLLPVASPSQCGNQVFQGELEQFHPGLRNSTSVVLHHHATTPDDLVA